MPSSAKPLLLYSGSTPKSLIKLLRLLHGTYRIYPTLSNNSCTKYYQHNVFCMGGTVIPYSGKIVAIKFAEIAKKGFVTNLVIKEFGELHIRALSSGVHRYPSLGLVDM